MMSADNAMESKKAEKDNVCFATQYQRYATATSINEEQEMKAAPSMPNQLQLVQMP